MSILQRTGAGRFKPSSCLLKLSEAQKQAKQDIALIHDSVLFNPFFLTRHSCFMHLGCP